VVAGTGCSETKSGESVSLLSWLVSGTKSVWLWVDGCQWSKEDDEGKICKDGRLVLKPFTAKNREKLIKTSFYQKN